MLKARYGEPLWLKYVAPERYASLVFPCMLLFTPGLPLPKALGVIPKSSPEHANEWKGEAGGGKVPYQVPCQTLLCGSPARLTVCARGSCIRLGLSNVKVVTQTSRKLKTKVKQNMTTCEIPKRNHMRFAKHSRWFMRDHTVKNILGI